MIVYLCITAVIFVLGVLVFVFRCLAGKTGNNGLDEFMVVIGVTIAWPMALPVGAVIGVVGLVLCGADWLGKHYSPMSATEEREFDKLLEEVKQITDRRDRHEICRKLGQTDAASGSRR